jgi:hypothetical protein
MKQTDVKLECLKLAVQLGSKDEKSALETAKKLYDFITT